LYNPGIVAASGCSNADKFEEIDSSEQFAESTQKNSVKLIIVSTSRALKKEGTL